MSEIISGERIHPPKSAPGVKMYQSKYPISRTSRGEVNATEAMKLIQNIRKEREQRNWRIANAICWIVAIVIVYLMMRFGG